MHDTFEPVNHGYSSKTFDDEKELYHSPHRIQSFLVSYELGTNSNPLYDFMRCASTLYRSVHSAPLVFIIEGNKRMENHSIGTLNYDKGRYNVRGSLDKVRRHKLVEVVPRNPPICFLLNSKDPDDKSFEEAFKNIKDNLIHAHSMNQLQYISNKLQYLELLPYLEKRIVNKVARGSHANSMGYLCDGLDETLLDLEGGELDGESKAAIIANVTLYLYNVEKSKKTPNQSRGL